eukprot:130316_1
METDECVKNGTQATSRSRSYKWFGRGNDEITPISSIQKLNTHLYGKFKAMCVMITIFQNSLYVILMDEYNTEITLMCGGYGDSVYFMNIFRKRCVYSVSDCPLFQVEQMNHPIIATGDKAIRLSQFLDWGNGCITPWMDYTCDQESDYSIQKGKFIKIYQIETLKQRFVYVNIIAMIVQVSSINLFNCECNDEKCLYNYQKYRNIIIQDKTGQFRITLWNKDADNIAWRHFKQYEFDINNVWTITLRRCEKWRDGLSVRGIVDIEKIDKDRPDFHKLLRKFNRRYNTKIKKTKCYECNRMNSADVRFKVCKQCKSTYYCNRKCQKRSWNKKHRYYCLTVVRGL